MSGFLSKEDLRLERKKNSDNKAPGIEIARGFGQNSDYFSNVKKPLIFILHLLP